jgi:hypothetical protein
MIVKLPKQFRPDTWYKKCALGVDLPAAFVRDLWGLDEHLYPVFMPYRCLWDSVINTESGSLEDPRYTVQYKYGHTNFGFVLTDGRGRPVEDGTWHLFRWCYPHGVAHVINLDSKDPGYLNLVLKRLYLQTRWNDKYGFKGYSKMMQELDEETREREMAERQDLMNEIGKANSGMMNRAAQNLASGNTAPTNVTKDIITSYSGQGNRSRIVRPATDREGGIVLPEGF